jgi:SAM-dependent methyltransferase
MAGNVVDMSVRGREPKEREQRLVFGEVAQQYDAARPSYPDAFFDEIIEFGELQDGGAALEIGAGTGKATVGFLARGFDVHALEPSPEMAAVLRAKGVDVEATTFEAYSPAAGTFRLAYAAQSWHWVAGESRYQRVADALAPGGTVALFWNQGREWTGPLGADNDAAYARHAPDLVGGRQGQLDWVADGMAACTTLTPPVRQTTTWSCTYTRDEWVRLLGTHSDHLLLPERQRTALHSAVGDAIDRHGGEVEVVYDVECFLSRRV